MSVGTSLGPVVANIFMTALEKIILNDLSKDSVIKFYIRYIDDTFMLVKPENIDKILKKFNSFDKSIQCTFDKFLKKKEKKSSFS